LFDFYLPTHIQFGCGSRNRLREILIQEQWTRVGIVLDQNIVPSPPCSQLLEELTQVSKKLIRAICTISEPTYDSLEEMRVQFEGIDLDCMIGLGGGSALDMAKAMAVLFNNRKPAIYYRGFDRMIEPVLPIIALPTTAGTGSEVTPNASFIDTQEKKKLGINGEAVRPRYALLDPELTLTCPFEPTRSAAVDSMVHAIEAFAAKKTNPLARIFAREGFRKVFHNLEALLKDLKNIDLRREVMYGAFLSGISLMHSGTGPAAALSYPLGVHYHVPHGIAGGVFLPKVMAYNISQGYYDYSALFEDNRIENPEAQAKAFLNTILSLWEEIGISPNLCRFGLEPGGITSFVEETLQLKGALDQNPVPFGRPEIEAVLRQMTEVS